MEKTRPRRRWIWIVLILIVVVCLMFALLVVTRITPYGNAPPPALLTTQLIVTITNAKITNPNGSSSFTVPSNSDLQIQSVSTDPSTHNCTIAGNGIPQPVSVQFSNTSASIKFQLPAGSYRLTCDNNPNRFATITTQ